jgi:hypothetical protein
MINVNQRGNPLGWDEEDDQSHDDLERRRLREKRKSNSAFDAFMTKVEVRWPHLTERAMR